MANDGTSGRRKQTDFQGLTFDDWPKTGAADRDARANKGGIQEETSAREAAKNAQPFEGSFETFESTGNHSVNK